MCGIFGFATRTLDEKVDMKRLAVIATTTESRGRHAFGFSWIDRRGVIRTFKQQGRISDNLGLLGMVEDAVMLIGHCRFATHGDPATEHNNHPHQSGRGWMVHNGVIYNHEALAIKHKLKLTTECDSEVAAKLAHKMGDLAGQTVQNGLYTAASMLQGAYALAGLWSAPKRMAITRNGNPARFGDDGACVYFASLSMGLPDSGVEMRNQAMVTYGYTRDGDLAAGGWGLPTAKPGKAKRRDRFKLEAQRDYGF